MIGTALPDTMSALHRRMQTWCLAFPRPKDPPILGADDPKRRHTDVKNPEYLLKIMKLL